MVEIFNGAYIIDLDEMQNVIYTDTDAITSETKRVDTLNTSGGIESSIITNTSSPIYKEFNTPMYEIIREYIMVISDPSLEIDFSLGLKRGLESTSIGFKLAFNTLLNYKILKKIK